MKSIIIAVTSIFIFIGTNAYAGIHIEPYIGYNGGTLDSKVSAVPIADGFTGLLFGARIGYSIPAFWAALDYSMASGLSSEVANQLGGSSSADLTRMGLTAGFTLLPLFDLMVGYITSADVDFGGTKLSGSGFKLGVGWTMLPLVSLVVEYQTLSYDNTGSLTDSSETALTASISLPLDL